MGNILPALSAGNNRDLFYGKHEVLVMENEIQMEETASFCDKQQLHDNMIPVEQFTIEHLPSDYRQEDIFKLILAIVALTVKLKVTYVSEDRPNLIPKTELPYPLSDRKGSGDCLSLGSGRVCDVVKKTGSWDETCKCSKCKISSSPSKAWWAIKIFTATSVVYDDKEANQTSCTFDVGKGKLEFELSCCKKVWSDVEGDLCLLEIVSCNQDLCENLFSTIKTFNALWHKLSQTFKHLNESHERLIVIVSYPHGTQKRISIGHGLDVKPIFCLNFSKYVYDAPTCPGSAGGPVYALGNDWFKTEYVHSGYRHDIDIQDNASPDSNGASSSVDPENIKVFFKNTPESNRPQQEQIFFTNSSCNNNPDTLAGSEYIPQSQYNIQKYSKYKGYSTRWY